jgi:hypothetical protein
VLIQPLRADQGPHGLLLQVLRMAAGLQPKGRQQGKMLVLTGLPLLLEKLP